VREVAIFIRGIRASERTAAGEGQFTSKRRMRHGTETVGKNLNLKLSVQR